MMVSMGSPLWLADAARGAGADTKRTASADGWSSSGSVIRPISARSVTCRWVSRHHAFCVIGDSARRRQSFELRDDASLHRARAFARVRDSGDPMLGACGPLRSDRLMEHPLN